MPDRASTFENLIGGEWKESAGRVTYEDENPAHRGTVLGIFQASTPQDASAAVSAAAAAFPGWRATPLRSRQEIIARFLDVLRDNGEALARIVAQENGKTIREARAEVSSALVEGSYHQRQVSALHGHTLPMASPGVTGWVQYHPLGVVAIISPWNFPVNVLCRKALPALLVGNTVVFKPASYTPWSGIFLAQLLQSADLPDGVFNCVTGAGVTLGAAMVGDDRVRAISFTGSTEVGMEIQQKAARRLVRTQLELGGKNALLVAEDADPEEAASAAVAAGLACAGQWCTSTSRILVQRGTYKTFLDALAGRCDSRILGDPLEEKTEMGPVAGSAQFERITRAIATAEAQGARRITGGRAAGSSGTEEGYFVPPTLFADVTPDMELFRSEIFGPVLAVTEFATMEDALRLANDSRYALSSAIFTRDLKTAFTYINGIEAGLAHVNMHTGFKEPALPFGGWKESGFGPPENDRTGLEFFVDRKSVYIRQE